MTTKRDLETVTNQFFELHWPKDLVWPKWNFDWKWIGAIPNYELAGVYALFADERLSYLGLGASRGGGIYVDRGVSRRLLAHVMRRAPDGADVGYVLRDRWQCSGVNLIATIGFPSNLSYLACALEDYLIGKLCPPENKMKRIAGTENQSK